jgi:hypothetical protein
MAATSSTSTTTTPETKGPTVASGTTAAPSSAATSSSSSSSSSGGGHAAFAAEDLEEDVYAEVSDDNRAALVACVAVRHLHTNYFLSLYPPWAACGASYSQLYWVEYSYSRRSITKRRPMKNGK